MRRLFLNTNVEAKEYIRTHRDYFSSAAEFLFRRQAFLSPA